MSWRFVFMAAVSGVVMLMFSGAIIATCLGKSAVPTVVKDFVFAANAPLAANLGAVLGISLFLKTWNPAAVLQWVAATWYFVMLVVAAVAWALKYDFADDVALLPELTKTLTGLAIAVLAAALGVEATRARGGTA